MNNINLPQPVAAHFADFLESHQEDILNSWSTRVGRDNRIPSTDDVNFEQLIDHLPQILTELFSFLRQSGSPDTSDALEDSSEIHGVQRWQQGYSLRDVLLEIEKLRKILLIDLMLKFVEAMPDVTSEMQRNIEHSAYGFFHEMIVGSVLEYTKANDEESRIYNETLVEKNEELDKVNKKLIAEESRVRALSLTDPLTDIANRRHVEHRLHEEIKRCQRTKQPLTVVMLDMDHFKAVNDKYGHDVGDQVLKHVASGIKGLCRSIDLVARFGGEEFVILLPNTQLSHARVLVERISKVISTRKISPMKEVVTGSFGIAQWMNSESAVQLVARADKAMYEAKDAGRNCIKVNGE